MNTAGLIVRESKSVAVGDKVRLSKPSGVDEPVGWHPFLDRLLGRTLTVRDVAKGTRATYVFFWESSQIARLEWVS